MVVVLFSKSKGSVRKYLIVFAVGFLQFHEYVTLALTLRQPYFCFRKVGILRWSFTGQQVSFLCRFLANVNQS